MAAEQRQIVVFDSNESELISTKKCIEYIWAGPILCETKLEATQPLLVNSKSDDIFVFCYESFIGVDIASWLLGTGFKGRLILMRRTLDELPAFLPCELLKVAQKPAKLHDFSDVISNAETTQSKKASFTKELIETILDRRDAFYLEFQPQYRAQTEKLWGFECFARFQHLGEKLETRKVLSAIAEFNLMETFSRVFFARLGELLPAFSGVHLSINFSLYDVENFDLLSVVKKNFDNTSINPEKIVFEFSCLAYFSSKTRAINLLTTLKSEGFQLAIEDGTALVGKLEKLPLMIDEVKLPISQLTGENMFQHHREISNLAHRMDVRIVMTKVERYQDVKMAASVAPNSIVQGYYLAPPVSIEHVFELLQANHSS